MMTIHNTNNDDDGDSSHDLNGDNEDVTISADDCRASSCNMSVSMDWAGPSVLPQKRQQQLPKVNANVLSYARSVGGAPWLPSVCCGDSGRNR